MSLQYSEHYELQEQVALAQSAFAIKNLMTITGASGTGKTFLAELIHQNSKRKNEPLVVQDAAALAESRAHSQLFGHAKGAFSGATHKFLGLAGATGKGILVIESIEDMHPGIQAQLLRFVQERIFRPVGSLTDQTFEGGLIFTSRFPLYRLKEQALIRDDLYYRIAASELHLPALSQRPSDFPYLAKRLVKQLAQNLLPDMRQPTSDDIEAIRQRKFPGNLHGLRNLLQQSMLRDIPPQNIEEDEQVHQDAELPRTGSLKEDLWVLEGRLLDRALREYHLPRTDLAAVLGISRRALIYKLKEHKLTDPER